MKMKTVNKILLMILAIFASFTASVQAAIIRISTLPFTISAPGTYVVTRDLSWFDPSGQPAITIQSPDNGFAGFAGPVILDLQGHTITGNSQGGVGFGTGILVVQSGLPNPASITVTNGTIINYATGVEARPPYRDMFAYAILLNNLNISGAQSAYGGAPGVTQQGAAIHFDFVANSAVTNCKIRSSVYGIQTIECGGGNHYSNDSFSSVNTFLDFNDERNMTLENLSWGPLNQPN
jgi:hypothetical protein